MKTPTTKTHWPSIASVGALAYLMFAISSQATTFTVTTTADSGPGSLRQAILDANGRQGTDTIAFNISDAGPHTIQPLSPLPTITDPVVIDGYTQPGASPNTLAQGDKAVLKIVLDGGRAGETVPEGQWIFGLQVQCGLSEIRGLVISDFGTGGILLQQGGTNVVQGCFIGTDAAGLIAAGNGLTRPWGEGVFIWGSHDNLIGGGNPECRNVVSGNDCGVRIIDGHRNVVQGNFIGTDAAGGGALPNLWAGVDVVGWSGSEDNLIGGSSPGEGNVISGNLKPSPPGWWDSGFGVYIGGGCVRTVLKGNFIGTDAAGTRSLPNGNGAKVFGADHLVGGTEKGAGNLISGNTFLGLELACTGIRVEGNLIGTDVTGAVALGNGWNGISCGGSGNAIGGTVPECRNVVSGNLGYGISILGERTRIQGNFVGTDKTGTRRVPSGGSIFVTYGSLNIIGGTEPGARNVTLGIDLRSPNNTVQGNYIGLDVTGTTVLAPSGSGIYLGDSADDNQIGGPEQGAGNVISGWNYGIAVSGRHRNRIQGNLIGTDASGTVSLGNGHGINIDSGTDNLIGGIEPGAGNVIAGAADLWGGGIVLRSASRTRIEGNFIGTDRTGRLALANTTGVFLWNGTTGTQIGGTQSGAGNLIAHNLRDGVAISSGDSPPFCLGNAIRGNSIRDNDYLGINLMPWGPEAIWSPSVVTANDLGDADAGPNNLENFPVLSLVSGSASSTTIEGTLNSTPSTAFTLDFYANSACDPSGYGEGERYLGFATVTTDDSGNVNFRVVLPVGVPVGWTITATATDPDGNTSEFSACSVPTVDATPPVIPTPANIVAEATSPAGAVVSFSVSAQDAVSGPVPVTCAPSSGSVFPLGTTTVTATATDAAGNTATATFTVTVRDTMAPIIQCPSDILVPCAVDLLVPVSFAASATDVCDPSPTITYSVQTGSGFPVRTTTVICTATDASGNVSSCSFSVTRAPLSFAGFLPPIGGADTTGGSFANPVRTFKNGSTIPVKFTASCGGAAVLSGVHRLQAIQYSDANTAGEAIDASPRDGATSGNQFRLADGQWHFNLDTKATGMSVGIWQLVATLSDGSEHTVWIQLK